MALPKSVQRQRDEANRIVRERGNPKPADPPAPAPRVDNSDSAPADPPTPAKPTAAAPDRFFPPKTEEGQYWHQRFKVIEGKYRAEVPPLADELRKVREANQRLEAQLEAARTGGDNPTIDTSPDGISALLKANLKPDEVDELDDLLAVVARAMSKALGKPAAPQAPAPPKPAAPAPAPAADQKALAQFWTALEAAHPDWEAINKSKDFEAYLLETDRLSGRTRNDLLVAAQDRLDAVTVIAFFDDFKERTSQSAGGKPVREPDPDTRGGAGSVDPLSASQDGKRIWDDVAVKEFYELRRRRKISDERFTALQNDLFQAMNEPGSPRYRGKRS